MKALLPEPFKKSMVEKLGQSEYDAFVHALETNIPTSIRIHREKFYRQKPEITVPWCSFGYQLEHRPVFTLDPDFHAGAYYVQEASSMYIYHILSQLGMDSSIKILDLCASPGGKSTLAATFLNNKGLLVANEIIKSRAYTLKYNLEKEGYSNVIVTHNDPKDFAALENFFDIIIVDAPCSGEGMFRKDKDSICEWSAEKVLGCSDRQKKILSDVYPALKQNGILLYSTCTYNDTENIDNVQWMQVQYGMQCVEMKNDPTWNISKIEKNKAFGYQFYPHKVQGEGFFVSVLRKSEIQYTYPEFRYKPIAGGLTTLSKKNAAILTDCWIKAENLWLFNDKTGTIHALNASLMQDAIFLQHVLRIIYCGITVGIFNKEVFIPDHGLALSSVQNENVPMVSLEKKETLLYLKKELQQINADAKSWVLVTYNHNGIGWLKNLGNRINNYLPNEYRIMMQLPV